MITADSKFPFASWTLRAASRLLRKSTEQSQTARFVFSGKVN